MKVYLCKTRQDAEKVAGLFLPIDEATRPLQTVRGKVNRERFYIECRSDGKVWTCEGAEWGETFLRKNAMVDENNPLHFECNFCGRITRTHQSIKIHTHTHDCQHPGADQDREPNEK